MAAFEIKDFALLKSSLLNYIYYTDNSLTDFNVGSVMRCMLESVAQEEEEMYFRLWQGIQNAIQQSILYSFNFVAEEGTYAVGLVTFGRDTVTPRNIIIPAGTIVLAPNGASYKTALDVVMLQNTATVTTQATATIFGSASNLLTPNTLMQMVNPIYGVTWVQNATSISGGTDTESQASVFTRFTNFIASLSRGTITAIQYGASTAVVKDASGNITSSVKKVKGYDYTNRLGYVDLYIDDGTGGASLQLINLAQKIVDGYTDAAGSLVEGWKSAGVIVNVQAVTPVIVNIVAILAAKDFYASSPYVSAIITQYFANLAIGQPLNYEKLVADSIYSNSGIIDITFTSPAGDIIVNPNEICVLGTLTINPGTALNGNL